MHSTVDWIGKSDVLPDVLNVMYDKTQPRSLLLITWHLLHDHLRSFSIIITSVDLHDDSFSFGL